MNLTRHPLTAAAVLLLLAFTACSDDPTGPDINIEPADVIANAFVEQADSVVTTESGLRFLRVEEGTGPEVQPGDSIVVNYRGQRTNGEEFANSYETGEPVRFVLGRTRIDVRGFVEGVDLMREGETAKMLLPPNLAYGDVPVAFEVTVDEVFPAAPTDPDNIIAEAFTEQAGSVTTTESGLQYLQVDQGAGAAAMAGDSVFVDYRGQFVNGVEFDNSYDRGEPLVFVVGSSGLIPGFSEGVALMQEGGRAKLLLPPDLAYGEFGSQSGSIPPSTTIYFDIELVEVR
ncbi:MAG: FKBP-type peptidyl-prolyl cis-trans isomerase [Rhodothermales bacterium]